ncbi:hypothetical protein ACLB2K_056918 [Fragaria x ananassa]
MTIPSFSSHFLLLIYYVSLSVLVLVVSGQCSSNQQQSLLLQLKKSLNFEPALSTKLVKWNNVSDDYCSWEGVFCKQGCVTQLDLSNESISGGLDNSSALFSLQYIENLNLAFNNFSYNQIPSEFNKLASLSHLNLSNAGFAWQIPIEISQLKRLVILDLSTFSFLGVPALQLEQPNLKQLIGNLSEIVELHLDGVNISAPGAQWCQAISSSLPKLRVLSLSSCNLLGPIDDSLLKLRSLSEIRIDINNLATPVPEFLSNFTNLTSLSLFYSGLHGTFPKKIFQVPTLQIIDLSFNEELQGSLPDFPKNAALQSLFLAKTNFSGSLPESIGNLKMLSIMDLSYCNFTGPIPKSMESLTELVYVDMSKNKFDGSVPVLSMAKNLTDIDLSYNELTGQVNSTQWQNLIKLVNLNLGNNELEGSIPSSLFHLPSLKQLVLSNNQFSGQLHEFPNVSSNPLVALDLSSNNLEGPVPRSIFNLLELTILTLSSNNFSGSFPLNSVQQLKNLSSIDLSYNSLLISYDSINSSQPSFPQITTLKLASGKLRTFPDFLRNQSTLSTLDLSQNQIHGEIPNWVWNLSSLSQLNLSCNSLVTLEGPLSNLTSLSVVDLHSNQLQGKLPIFRPSATYLDYSRNNFSSTIPDDIGDFLNYTVFLSLSSNNLTGSIPVSICNAANIQVLDLSDNFLTGIIPPCLTAMNGALVVLNLRRNKLDGTIPDTFSGHCTLKTLDFNGNCIKGQFPKSLANCTVLEVLNLGNNQITDTFPCLLKSISTLRVVVLRSNRFYNRIGCSNTTGTWPILQIIDIAHNNFSGEIPGRCLTTWRAMMGNEDDAQSKINHQQFQVLQFSDLNYQDVITVTTKGVEMELVKMLSVIFTSIDISCNNFNGSIPPQVGQLKALDGLNLSNNALTGPIPPSLGNLRQLESLDLSNNSLSGPIPQVLTALTFLSFLNLSYNQLSGTIPMGNQFSTFDSSSYEDNEGLCGAPLLVKCSNSSEPPDAPSKVENKESGIGLHYISVESGFTCGFGIAIASLLFCKRWRIWYYRTMRSILFKIFPQLEERFAVVSGQCASNQQSSLLLQLKNSLNFNSSLSTKLVKWKNASDYCSWEGVSCKQGCVTQLDLSNESISGGLGNSSALFSLLYIENLNLAFNNFNNNQIPSEFNKLASLSHLNLSNAGFAWQIPIEISQLTRLVFLDLSTIYFPGVPALQLENPNLKQLIGNLSEIVELHLDGVNISAPGAQWCQAISSSLPKLRVLSLSSCNLLGPIDDSLLKLRSLSEIRIESNNLSAPVPEFLSNFTNLTSLRLMNSGLQGTFPKEILQVRTLQIIDLIGNQDLHGSLPDFPENGALRSLFLARTKFSGPLPEFIGNLKMLSRVDLSYCNFTGQIPKSLASLTELVYVDMTGNKFNGSVPVLSIAKNLTDINLSYNELTGQINSTHWENLTKLVNLNLGDNKLSGSIPSSLFSLPLLQKLQLSNNQFSGQLPEFAKISRLDTLDLSSNNLEGPLPMSIFGLRGLKILSLSSNNFSGSFPLDNVQQLKNLSSLDLSYNSLSVSYNSTKSSESFPNITTLNLASGQLRAFPEFLRNQSKLNYLDLSQNQIQGEIPHWIWRLSNLRQLNLSCNSLVTLEGPFLNLSSTLYILDLHSNQLQGHIPIFPPLATYLDYSRNNFSSSIPDNIGDFLHFTKFFSISSNRINGSIPRSICKAAFLQVLDLSNNSLSDSIPQCLTEMTGTLVVLNLRRNELAGSIPDKFPGNCSLKTLDFNGNYIEGQFPKSLAKCTMLEVLNAGSNQIKDTFPCLLKNISTLRVLVLRSNRYHGRIGCSNTTGTWPMLQIVDIGHNNFSGKIPGGCLTTWQAMTGNEDDAQSKINHLQFQVLQFSDLNYQDAITVTTKGVEMEFVKILTVFTSIDLSCNNFNGSIPPQVGQLKALYALNLSNNALTGPIPPSLGNLTQLESLDLSNNSLSGPIPQGFTELTFLSSLNLSYNQLSGTIPIGNQFSTFDSSSYEDNEGLCGAPLLVKCSNSSKSPDAPSEVENKESGIGLDWPSIYTGLGFGVGAGVVVILLMLWEEGRNWMDNSIDRILLVILPMMGYSYRTRQEWDDDDEEEDYGEEIMFFVEKHDQDEIESEDKGFQGPFCVFCSKLDISRKSAIHNPNCTCHLSPPMSSTSSSSSSFSS